MSSTRYPVRKTRKTKSMCLDNEEPQTNIIEYQSERQQTIDPEIQHSNSLLSKTLSTAYTPKQLLCRQSEKQQISKFVKNCILHDAQQGSRCLYISGVPGIGKTASIMQIIQNMKKSISRRKVAFKYVNAMTFSVPNKIYGAMNKQFYKDQKLGSGQSPAIKLFERMKDDKRIKVLVIDQIDYLYTKNQTILYNLFQWCNDQTTKLCLIVVANTMDFPQRLQKKITSRMGSNRLVFKPYNHHEVKQIIEDRLMKSNRFSNDAIQYACKKMASYTSDVRKLLDILRRSLELKKQGTITIDDMTLTWRICAQECGDLWQEHLPQHYRVIADIIKDCGGVANEYKIHQRIQSKRQCTVSEILINLKQMQELGLVRLKQKTKKILRVFEVTLLKI